MKILFVYDSNSKGGKERRFTELINSLALDNSIKTSIFFITSNFYYDFNDPNIKIVYHPRKFKYDFSVIWKIFRYCQKERPSIIHSWGIIGSLFSIIPAKILKIKLIDSRIADTNPNFNSMLSIHYLKHFIINSFSDILVSNTKLGADLYHVKEEKAVIIPNGINTKRFQNLKNKDKMRKELGIESKFVVTMIARFAATKDYGTFFKVAEKITHNRDDVSFIAVGSGEFFDIYYKKIRQLNFEKKIFLLGQRKDVEDIINISDIGVLASYSEGFPNVILEFMALGKPQVISKVGGMREMQKSKQKYCYTIEKEDYNSLINKIYLLLDQKNKYERMSFCAIKVFKEKYTAEIMVNNYKNLYAKL